MDHKEQHHQHHQKEREEKKAEHREHDREVMDKPRVIHPLWFLVLGVLLIVLIILTWTFFLS